MGLKLYPEESVQAIASAIRDKNGSSDTYTIGQMSQAIEDIPTGGGGVEIIELTKDEYDSLPSEDKLDENKIYFVSTNEPITYPVLASPSRWINTNEKSMSVFINNDGELEYVWNGMAYIGCNSKMELSSDVNKIKIELETGTSWYNSHIPLKDRFQVAVAVSNTNHVGLVAPDEPVNYDLHELQVFTDDNSSWTYTIDYSNVQGIDTSRPVYLYLIAHGWNLTVHGTYEYFSVTTDKDYIMYKDVPYYNFE